jgi:hypothetical protein
VRYIEKVYNLTISGQPFKNVKLQKNGPKHFCEAESHLDRILIFLQKHTKWYQGVKLDFLKRALEKIFLSHKNNLDIGNSINLGLLTALGFRGRINCPKTVISWTPY